MRSEIFMFGIKDRKFQGVNNAADGVNDTACQDVAYAPIAKGDVLGEITLSYEGRVCATVPLLAQFDVNASQFLIAKLQVEQFFAQRIVKIALVAIVLLVAAIVIWWKFFRRKRRYGSHGGRRRSRRSYRGRRR